MSVDKKETKYKIKRQVKRMKRQQNQVNNLTKETKQLNSKA